MAQPNFMGRALKAGREAIWPNAPLLAILAAATLLLSYVNARSLLKLQAQSYDAPVPDVLFARFSGANLIASVAMFFLYGALLFGAHSAVLYRRRMGAAPAPGFGHFAYAPGGLGAFFGRLIVIGFRLFLIALPLMVLLMLAVFSLGPNATGSSLFILGLAAIGLIVLAVSMRYGLALPAVVAGDADVSLDAAIMRAQPRLSRLVAFQLLLLAAVVVAQFILGMLAPSAPAVRLSVQPTPQELQALQEAILAQMASPLNWILMFVNSLLGLISAIFTAGALSTGYLDATEEGLTQPAALG